MRKLSAVSSQLDTGKREKGKKEEKRAES